MNTGGIIKPKLILTNTHGDTDNRLKIFLCHASEDKLLVRSIYELLKNANFNPWLAEDKLMPGAEKDEVITNEISRSNIIIICLSSNSVSKTGFVQKEIRNALEVATLQPDGKIFIMPIKFNECQIPLKLSKYQYLDYFSPNAKEKLISTLTYIQTNTTQPSNHVQNKVEEIDLFLGFIDDLNIVIEKSVFLNVLLIVVSAESGSGEMYAYKEFIREVYPYISESILESEIYLAFANKNKHIFARSLVGNQLKQKFNLNTMGIYYISNGSLIDFQKSKLLDDPINMLEKIARINF